MEILEKDKGTNLKGLPLAKIGKIWGCKRTKGLVIIKYLIKSHGSVFFLNIVNLPSSDENSLKIGNQRERIRQLAFLWGILASKSKKVC